MYSVRLANVLFSKSMVYEHIIIYLYVPYRYWYYVHFPRQMKCCLKWRVSEIDRQTRLYDIIYYHILCTNYIHTRGYTHIHKITMIRECIITQFLLMGNTWSRGPSAMCETMKFRVHDHCGNRFFFFFYICKPVETNRIVFDS